VTCQRLTTDQAEILVNKLRQICTKCAHPNGRFDYDSSLSRLESAAGEMSLEVLHSVTKLESILLRDDQLTGGSEKEVEFRGEEDVISKEIISRYPFGKNISLNMFFTRRYYYMVDCTTANAVIIHVNLCNNIQKNITRL
jgi:hypothetical protein